MTFTRRGNVIEASVDDEDPRRGDCSSDDHDHDHDDRDDRDRDDNDDDENNVQRKPMELRQ